MNELRKLGLMLIVVATLGHGKYGITEILTGLPVVANHNPQSTNDCEDLLQKKRRS